MASGDSLIVLVPAFSEPPQQITSPETYYPTIDRRNEAMVLAYDDSREEVTEFPGFLPRHYAGGGFTITIGWMAATATSGNVVWSLAFKSLSDDADDIDTKAFAAAKSITNAPASVSGEIKYSTITFNDGSPDEIDALLAGEYFRMQVKREGDNGSDTMSGDAQIVFIEVQET